MYSCATHLHARRGVRPIFPDTFAEAWCEKKNFLRDALTVVVLHDVLAINSFPHPHWFNKNETLDTLRHHQTAPKQRKQGQKGATRAAPPPHATAGKTGALLQERAATTCMAAGGGVAGAGAGAGAGAACARENCPICTPRSRPFPSRLLLLNSTHAAYSFLSRERALPARVPGVISLEQCPRLEKSASAPLLCKVCPYQLACPV